MTKIQLLGIRIIKTIDGDLLDKQIPEIENETDLDTLRQLLTDEHGQNCSIDFYYRTIDETTPQAPHNDPPPGR